MGGNNPDHALLREIHAALLAALPTQHDLEMATRFGLNLNLAAVTTADGLRAQLDVLLTHVLHLRRLRALLDAAPANPLLRALRERHGDARLDALRPLSTLTTGTDTRPLDPAPSQLLDARYQFIPWRDQGRENDLAALEEWATQGDPSPSLCLLHAEGGVGKTRLAIEWSHRLRDAGWDAGFLPPEPGPAWITQLQHGAPVLVVIEYAESRSELASILRALRGLPQRTRVLLLARNAGDWWATADGRDHALRAWMDARPPRLLPPAAPSPPERTAVFEEALHTFCSLLRVVPPTAPRPELSDGRFDRVLYLHMAALAAVRRASFTASSLMDLTLDHEENFWLKRARDAADPIELSERIGAARKLVVAATLRGGFALRADADAVAARLHAGASTAEDTRLTTFLHRIYHRPGAPVWQPGLEPDLLGEAMVLRLAQGPRNTEEHVDDAWIERVLPAAEHGPAVQHAFTVMGRAASERATAKALRPWMERLLVANLAARAVPALEAAKLVGQRTAFSILGEVLCCALDSGGSVEIAQALETSGVPERTVSLAKTALWVARTLRLALPGGDDEASIAKRARRLGIEANRLRALGRPEEALRATQEAVNTYRTLAEGNPNDYLPNLAVSLNNLGVMLSDLGRREDALRATQEAADTYRILAQKNSDDYLLYLAMSLNNLGLGFRDLCRIEEALRATQEAADTYRTLAQKNPDAFLPNLAVSLNNLGVMFSASGRREDALRATQEAADTYRNLAQNNPDAFLPNLAVSLNSLGNRLRDLKRGEDALRATQEAADTFRTLAQKNSDAFFPNFAASLNNLGLMLRDLERGEDALRASEEAADTYRTLAQKNPDAFLPDLALSLVTLGHVLNSLDRPADALLVTRDAHEIYWNHFLRLPDAFAKFTLLSFDNLVYLHTSLSLPIPPELAERAEALAPHRPRDH